MVVEVFVKLAIEFWEVVGGEGREDAFGWVGWRCEDGGFEVFDGLEEEGASGLERGGIFFFEREASLGECLAFGQAFCDDFIRRFSEGKLFANEFELGEDFFVAHVGHSRNVRNVHGGYYTIFKGGMEGGDFWGGGSVA